MALDLLVCHHFLASQFICLFKINTLRKKQVVYLETETSLNIQNEDIKKKID